MMLAKYDSRDQLEMITLNQLVPQTAKVLYWERLQHLEIHDSQILEPLVEQVIEKIGKPEAVAADVAYKFLDAPPISNVPIDNQENVSCLEIVEK